MNTQSRFNGTSRSNKVKRPTLKARLKGFLGRTTKREPATFWAFASLASVVLAFTAFNFGPTFAPQMQPYLHAAHGESRHLFSLQQQYVRLERDLSILRDQKSVQDSKIALLEDNDSQSLSRLARLEIDTPRQIAALSATTDEIVTGSVDTPTTIETNQPQLQVTTQPLVPGQNLNQPLPGINEATPTNTSIVEPDVNPGTVPASDNPRPANVQTPFALDLGVQESEAAARTYWLRLSSRIGTAFLGLSPKVADAEIDGLSSGKRLVVGPLETISESLLLCAQLETRNIKCETGLFEGTDL